MGLEAVVKALLLQPGRSIAQHLAKLVNRFMEAEGLAEYSPQYHPDDITADWLRHPRDSAAYVEEDVLIGFCYAWSLDSGEGRVRVYFDPDHPAKTDAVKALLAWSRSHLTGKHTAIVEIGGMVKDGEAYRLLKNILSSEFAEKESSYLMRLKSRLEKPPLRDADIVFKTITEHRQLTESIIDQVVEVYNDAFSTYGGEWRWSPRDAQQYYQRLFTNPRRKPILILALKNNTVVGFVEAYGFTSLSNSRTCYISLLAVRREMQGRGIGSNLLAKAVETLDSIQGCDIVYLDSLPRPRKLYEQLGFTVEKVYVRLRGPTYSLPSEEYGLIAENWENRNGGPGGI